jgi:hypothetical protein
MPTPNGDQSDVEKPKTLTAGGASPKSGSDENMDGSPTFSTMDGKSTSATKDGNPTMHTQHMHNTRAMFDSSQNYFANKYPNETFDYLDESHNLPPMVHEFFGMIRHVDHGEGALTPAEMDKVASVMRHISKSNENNGGTLDYRHHSKRIRTVLAGWDLDGSGTVDVNELMAAAAAQKKMQKRVDFLKRLVLLAMILAIVLGAATFGLSLAAVELSKETETDDSGLMVSKKHGTPVAVSEAASAVGLLDLAKASTTMKMLAAVKRLQVETLVGDTYGFAISGFSRSKTETVLRSSDGYQVRMTKLGAKLKTPSGLEYAVKTHDGAGRRLQMDNNVAQLHMQTVIADVKLAGFMNNGQVVESDNIQDSECTQVYDMLNCEVIDKCDWDYISKECHWRCNFLTDSASCADKGAAPAKKSRGCHWFTPKSEITGTNCDFDCTQRSSLLDCVKSPKCMWSGVVQQCEVACVQYSRGQCAIAAEQGNCAWTTKQDGSTVCKHVCHRRPDRDTCDPGGQGTECEWDDCLRKCKDSTKAPQWDLAGKRKLQLESDCFERGVNSRWYWNYQCTGKHSHCWIEDYKTVNQIWRANSEGVGNKCDFGTFNLQHCLPDCEALNKLALDEAYKEAEPKFATSAAKAEHFCNIEKAYCEWKGGKCQWKMSCDQSWPSSIIKTKPFKTQEQMINFRRMDMCDKQTCTAARSGGGSNPLSIHGQCMDVKVVRGVGRLRNQRCFLKCELRSTKEHCMSIGEGGRLKDTYEGKPCGPMKLNDNGVPDDVNGKMQYPQECVSMCAWKEQHVESDTACYTACEFRETEQDCIAGGCNWDADPKTGVKEYGGLPDLIKCTGRPNKPLFTAGNVAMQAANQVAGFTRKGGAGFIGPVSTCILADRLSGKEPSHCYSDVALTLDERYEQKWVAPTPGVPAPTPFPSQCVQDPEKTINVPDLYVLATKFGDTFKEEDKKKLSSVVWRERVQKMFAEAMNFKLEKDKYKVDEKKVVVGIVTNYLPNPTQPTSFTMNLSIAVTLPAGHRPSGVIDAINGNPARSLGGFLQTGSSESKEFAYTFNSKAFDDKWKDQTFVSTDGNALGWEWNFKSAFGAMPQPDPIQNDPLPPFSCTQCKDLNKCGTHEDCTPTKCPTECPGDPTPPTPTKDCVGDHTKWTTAFGPCSTYGKGGANQDFCKDTGNDGSGTARLAEDVCPDCLVCKLTDAGSGTGGGISGGGGNSLPACVKPANTWDGGYGGCEKYAPDKANHVYCDEDQSQSLTASQACSECGKCSR